MARRPKFTLVFAPEAIEHLDVIDRKYHSLLRKTIRDQLSHVPLQATRNRKRLEQPAPFAASWELRCGPDNRFRVLYEVDPESRIVSVLAVGVKDRSRVQFGREEYHS